MRYDSDDDFCCAADEEVEAGSMGMIANKINKFENYNVMHDIHPMCFNEKASLKKIIGQLKELKQKTETVATDMAPY